MRDLDNYNLLNYNTFGIEAKCKRFVEFSAVSELQQFILSDRFAESPKPLLLLGGGSNLLLTGDFPGTVLHSAIKGVEVLPDGSVRVGSGVAWDDLVAMSVEQGWYGAENLSLIPGDVGASAVQNIGAYGVEARDLIELVETVELPTGQVKTFSANECGYGYRQSNFKNKWKNRYFVTHVVYRFSEKFTPNLDYGNLREILRQDSANRQLTPHALRQAVINVRKNKLPNPKTLGNAGSFFMNPVVPRSQYEHLAAQYPTMPHYPTDNNSEKIPAGWLIEQCGWKGKTLGRAGVYDKQALVLVNHGGATGQEILQLCETVRDAVREKFNIDIQPEVNIV